MCHARRSLWLAGTVLFLAALACVQQAPQQVIIITATPPPAGPVGVSTLPPEAQPSSLPAFTPLPEQQALPTLILPTLDPPRSSTAVPLPESYTVQAGDTLSAIALRFGTSLDTLLSLNNLQLDSILSVGQVLSLPALSGTDSPVFKIIPDSELVRSPATADFDTAAFVNGFPGYLRSYTDLVDERALTGAQIVQRVADEFSVNPRLLLALLEYRSGWLLHDAPEPSTLLYPMGYAQLNFEGLYRQLSWTANRLNLAYYNWRLSGQTWFEFETGTRLTYGPGLNAGTVAVQYFLSLNQTYEHWLPQVGAEGVYKTYLLLFGDPFSYAVEPLLPLDLTQPPMQLPFAQGETWYYTGGPHGGYGSGSAWSAVDFAPPGDENTRGCFIAPQYATAVADGVIARSGGGFVILDLDFDGDETTGWTVVYLHLSSEGIVPAGTRVSAGDLLGRPSCEGGVSNATHLHIARRYNGEWVPAQCHRCLATVPAVPFILGGWTVGGIEGQEYQGYMTRGEEYRQAEQGRDNPLNELSW